MVDWLKLLHSFPRNPKLRIMARSLKCDKDSAIGFAVRWLIWVDEQTEDGRTGLLPKELDMELDRKGAAAALQAAGWARLADDDGTVCAIEFGKHCGESAKKRANDARRQSDSRARKSREAVTPPAQPVTDLSQQKCDARHADVTAAALPEKEEEFNNNTSLCSTVDIKAAGGTGERESRYADWLTPLVLAHPAGRVWNPASPLPEDAVKAAAAAFKSYPKATEHAELLAAYLADRLREDRRGNAFFRPKLLRVYFEQLGTTISEAQRWQKETGWKPKKPKKKAVEVKPAKPAEEMTDEERLAFFRSLNEADLLNNPMHRTQVLGGFEEEDAPQALPGYAPASARAAAEPVTDEAVKDILAQVKGYKQ